MKDKIDSIHLSSTCQIPGLDFIYKTYFKDTVRGTFVEVGAADGETCSNTSCLADIGWRGIYIEPIQEMAEMCLLRHRSNDVRVFNVAIDEIPGTVKLSVAGLLTTGSPETLKAYESIAWAKNVTSKASVREVRTVPLQSILDQELLNVKIDLLVVDVEGAESAVFKSFDLNKTKPKMMIVELCDVHPDLMKVEALRESAKHLRKLIIESGYIEIWKDHSNTVFIQDPFPSRVTPEV